MLLDPTNDRTYLCDSKQSAAWDDIERVLSEAAAKRFRRLSSSLKQVCDVPVVQEWLDWASPYESGAAALDGLAAQTLGGSTSSLSETAARASSSVLRWKNGGWLVASRIDLGTPQEAASRLPAVIDDLASLGCRSWFVRPMDAALDQAVASEAARRAIDGALGAWSPSPVFFPESAANPASAMKLPGGKWWLPAPFAGNRIDLGSRFFAYRLSDADKSFFALWTKGGAIRTKLRMTDPKKALFMTVDGSDPRPKLVKGGVEVDVGELPLIISGTDELPIPDYAVRETIWRFDELLKVAESLRLDTTDYRFLFKDANDGMDRNPGGNYTQLRDQYLKLSGRLAKYTWIEAENVQNTNFSEVFAAPGASNNSVLSLRTALAGSGEAYTAEYPFSPRTEDDLDVWIAARIPADQRQNVRVIIGGLEMKALEGPLSLYGAGFGWYRMGVVRLKRGETKALVRVSGADFFDLAIDAILLTPIGFVPNGAHHPDAMTFPPMPDK